MVRVDDPGAASEILRPVGGRTSRWPRSQGTRRTVLDAAGRLFVEQGYDDTSIDDIVKRSGVSVGSVYHASVVTCSARWSSSRPAASRHQPRSSMPSLANSRGRRYSSNERPVTFRTIAPTGPA